MHISRNQKRLACALLCAVTVFAAARARHVPDTTPASYAAYYENVPLNLSLVAPRMGQRAFTFGPWRLGARVSGHRASDRRPNLYLVIPGPQHQILDGGDEWDHNAVLSTVPPEMRKVEWDVIWAIILDPALRDVRSERDLLVAGEASFTTGDLFEFDDLPSAQFLREYLNVESLVDLAPYRRKDGRLPRLIIVPAGYAIRGQKS